MGVVCKRTDNLRKEYQKLQKELNEIKIRKKELEEKKLIDDAKIMILKNNNDLLKVHCINLQSQLITLIQQNNLHWNLINSMNFQGNRNQFVIGQRQQIIRLLKPYDIFGYRACLVHEAYNSSASAFEASTVYRIKRNSFCRYVENNSALCYQVMLMMAKDLAFSEIQTVNLTQKHIRGRLAESLLLLKKNYGFEEDGRTLAMLLPREDLANMSNMTTSNAIRTLSQFAQEGILNIDGRHIKILDEKTLEKISRLG
jgi:CRP-like cAMP-binding protein